MAAPAPAPAATAVYVAAVPLRAPRGPAQAVMSAGYALRAWDLQHFVVLLRPDPAAAEALAYDFLPREPEDALAALAVLSRRAIPGANRARRKSKVQESKRKPRTAMSSHSAAMDACSGVVRRRTLARVPAGRRCWLVGECETDAVGAADAFSARWPAGLVLGEHDCRDYTNGWAGRGADR
ncbi:hypothetical protein ACP4OV_005980 [Aristida adscensionis]